MHSTIDSLAQESRLKDFSAEVKMLFALLSLGIAISSQSFVAPLTIALIMIGVTLGPGGIPLRSYLKWLSPPLLFAIPPLIIMPFFVGGESEIFSFHFLGYSLAAHVEGVNLALLVTGRLLGGVSSLFFLAFTTPMVEIFALLERLRVPPVLLEMALLIYRYIFVVLEEAEKMLLAMKSRGQKGSLSGSLRGFGLLGANLFARALARGERLNTTLESRGYAGRLKMLHRPRRIPLLPLVLVVAFELTMGYLALITRGVSQ